MGVHQTSTVFRLCDQPASAAERYRTITRPTAAVAYRQRLELVRGHCRAAIGGLSNPAGQPTELSLAVPIVDLAGRVSRHANIGLEPDCQVIFRLNRCRLRRELFRVEKPLGELRQA